MYVRSVLEYVHLFPNSHTTLQVFWSITSLCQISYVGFQDAEAQADQSSLDIQVPQLPRQSEAIPDVRHDENQISFIATVHSYPEDTKL